MVRIPSAAIDPYVLLLPDPCNTAEQIEGFILGLIGWSETLSRKDLDVFISDGCVEALYQDGWCPYTGRIDRLIKKYGLQEELDDVNEKTVIQVAQKIFNRMPRLETRVGVSFVLCEEDDIQVEPAILIERLGVYTGQALKTSLVMLSIGLQHLHTLATGCIFASIRSSDVPQLSEVTITSAVHGIDFDPELDLSIVSEFPMQLTENLHICLGHSDLVQQADVLDLWAEAASDEGARDAINAEVAEIQRGGLPTGEVANAYEQGLRSKNGIAQFQLGANFLTSARSFGFSARSDWASTLIETCARVVLMVPKHDVEEFRTDARPQASQVARKKDGARGWRTHVTRAHEGFRLMFWTTPDGIIEFSNVGPKKELAIYD